MPIRDIAAMNASLDNDYGSTHGSNSPSSHALALFYGDPVSGGVELDASSCPGYARKAIPAAAWASADGGYKSLTVPAQFDDATAAWTYAPTHWALIATGEVMWDCAPLNTPVQITSAGEGPQIMTTVFYDDNISIP